MYRKGVEKVGILNSVKKFTIKLGIYEEKQELDPDSFQGKVVFIVSQLIYTTITILPTKLFYGEIFN